jgi:hypothetical protein
LPEGGVRVKTLSLRKFLSQHGLVPVVVIWCVLALVLGALAGISAYFLAQGFTAILAVIATLIIVFVGILPNLAPLIRKTKDVVHALKYKPEEVTDDAEKEGK